MVRRLPASQRYEPLPQGLKALAALLVLRDKVIQPLLAGALQTRPARGTQNPTRLDHHYEALRLGMRACSTNLVSPHEHEKQFSKCCPKRLIKRACRLLETADKP